MGQRSIITSHPVSILNLIGTVKTLKPVCRLTFESWLQLDNLRITYCRFSRVESQAFRFDNDGLIQEAIHTGTRLARQLPDTGPADLVGYFTWLTLLSHIKLSYRTSQFPARLRQNFRCSVILDDGTRTLHLHICIGLRITPSTDSDFEVVGGKAALAAQLRNESCLWRQPQ
ncbi:hypothetical protein D3C84_551540 [compost metagenome]